MTSPTRSTPMTAAHCRSACPYTIVIGALNLYATKPEAFDEDAIVLAQTFSGYAAVALANAHLYDATATALVADAQRRPQP
jgi:GAF domain-containing protein